MNNKKAKKLRKIAKNTKPWIVYKDKKYHAISRDRKLILIDPIKMGECGRLTYKKLKKEND